MTKSKAQLKMKSFYTGVINSLKSKLRRSESREEAQTEVLQHISNLALEQNGSCRLVIADAKSLDILDEFKTVEDRETTDA